VIWELLTWTTKGATYLIRLKNTAHWMHAVFALCACVFTPQCRLDAVVLLYSSVLLFTKITLQSSFRPYPQHALGPGM